LGDECEKHGRRRVFDVLNSCLAAEREDISYAKFAKALGVQEAAVKGVVHRLRGRYRALLREEVAQTVEEPKAVDDELRYLLRCSECRSIVRRNSKPEYRNPTPSLVTHWPGRAFVCRRQHPTLTAQIASL
jgi:hypothetical protein